MFAKKISVRNIKRKSDHMRERDVKPVFIQTTLLNDPRVDSVTDTQLWLARKEKLTLGAGYHGLSGMKFLVVMPRVLCL